MTYDLGEQMERSRPGGRWLRASAWPLVVLLGWLLFELTAQPALAFVALCLKLGWNDFRTAWWLRRRDPRPGRGLACLLLYASSGLWKVTLTAFLLMIILVVALAVAVEIAGPQNRPMGEVEQQLMAAALTIFLGSALALPLTGAALVVARLSRVKLWLSGRVHQARRDDCWPPPDEIPPGPNRLGILALVVVVLTWLVALGGIIALLASAFGARQNRGAAGALPFVAILGGWGLGIASIYFLQNYLERAVFARSPSECWGRSVPGHGAPGSPPDVSA
jgi:hypothetical protein